MIELLNIDCMIKMAEYADKYFDLAIVDPPYGLKISNSEYLGNDKNDKRWSGRANGYRHTIKNWDNSTPTKEYFDELKRVSKNQIVWGWNYFVEYFDECPSYIVWDKEASGNYSDCEMAWCSIKGTNKIFKWLWNGFRKQKPQPRIHPTEKPIQLYKWLLKNYAKEGDKILDTHGGSMSSVIACIDGGFDMTCCEIDADYYEAGKSRVMNHVAQLDMYIKRPEIKLSK